MEVDGARPAAAFEDEFASEDIILAPTEGGQAIAAATFLKSKGRGRKDQNLRIILAIHFDKHVTINIAQRLQDPALCLVTLFLIEVRRRFVRFDRHADHQPFGYFTLSEQSGQNGNSGHQPFVLQGSETRLRITLQSLCIGVLRHGVT
jgi:hypothetical protein